MAVMLSVMDEAFFIGWSSCRIWAAKGQVPGVMRRGSGIPSIADVVVRLILHFLICLRVLGDISQILSDGFAGAEEEGAVDEAGTWSVGSGTPGNSFFGKFAGETVR
jgi:hypothetical protein